MPTLFGCIALSSVRAAADGETSGADSSKTDFVLLVCSHAFDSKQLAQNMTFIIDIQSCFTTLDVCNDCRVMGKTHTGALQVAVPFMCWHSGWHAKQVLFTIASRGSLQKTNNKTPRFKQLHVKWNFSSSPFFWGQELNCKHVQIQCLTETLTEICKDKQLSWMCHFSCTVCLPSTAGLTSKIPWIVFGLSVAFNNKSPNWPHVTVWKCSRYENRLWRS